MISINDDSFTKEVGEYKGVVVVDFWAVWCMPCQMLSPVIEEIADQMAEKAKFAKVNVDEAPAVSQQFGIMSIPTIIVFKDGKEVQRHVGVMPKSVYVESINGNLD